MPTGTPVLDWTVPQEWNVARRLDRRTRTASASSTSADSNLHVVATASRCARRMSLAELQEHLHSLPEQPDWIPYRTSYYKRELGLLPRRTGVLESLPEGEYEVCIDSTLARRARSPTARCSARARREDEVLFSTYVCHPSLANDNLSGIALLRALARRARARRRLRYSLPLPLRPGTIGPIAWLARNEERLERIEHGLVLPRASATRAR